MLPRPIYLKNINIINETEITTPKNVFAKIDDKEKKSAEKSNKKNIGIIKKEDGSVKKIKAASEDHKNTMIIKVGKKFFLSFICLCLTSLLMSIFYPSSNN